MRTWMLRGLVVGALALAGVGVSRAMGTSKIDPTKCCKDGQGFCSQVAVSCPQGTSQVPCPCEWVPDQ